MKLNEIQSNTLTWDIFTTLLDRAMMNENKRLGDADHWEKLDKNENEVAIYWRWRDKGDSNGRYALYVHNQTEDFIEYEIMYFDNREEKLSEHTLPMTRDSIDKIINDVKDKCYWQ